MSLPCRGEAHLLEAIADDANESGEADITPEEGILDSTQSFRDLLMFNLLFLSTGTKRKRKKKKA